MAIKILEPIKETSEDFERLEVVISKLFKDNIYLPLVKEIGADKDILINSTGTDLITAIKSGRMTFYRGEFKGKLNASLTRELRSLGATWDRRQGTFKIPLYKLPEEYRDVIASSEFRFTKLIERVMKKLSDLVPEQIADKLKATSFFDTAIFKTEKKIQHTLRNIKVMPELSKENRIKISEAYNNNMKLYIKNWTEEEIKKLRKRVSSSIMKGDRYESMIATIQRSYGVSQNKAKFLARQETSLLMTQFKQTRYLDAGSEEYIWKCVAGSKNHPVRKMHKNLDGLTFKWKDPPVTDEKGNRNNPGQDYNCRCFARPIVRF